MSDFDLYLREFRHIFCTCPDCGEVHRIGTLRLSMSGETRTDWLDLLDERQQQVNQKLNEVRGRENELKARARAKAMKEVLPAILAKQAPAFASLGIDPREVRTLASPVDFIAFRGLSQNNVTHLSFVHLGPENAATRSIQETIDRGSVGWNTLRIGNDGVVRASR